MVPVPTSGPCGLGAGKSAVGSGGGGGRAQTRELFDTLYEEEIGLLQEVPNIADASQLFREMIVSDDFTEFLTLPAYELLD